MNFSSFVGHDDAKLALILNAIDARCGGVLLWGEKGTGKSTLARLFRDILPEEAPFVEVPLNITEDGLLGGVDIERALSEGRKVLQPGVLSRADGGVVFIDDINLLPPAVLALIAEAYDRSENVVEREGLSHRQRACFIPVASMNPEESAVSPHFLDRFGMCVATNTLSDRLPRIDIMKAPAHNAGTDSDESLLHELREKIAGARERLAAVSLSHEIEEHIVGRCLQAGAEGHRGEMFLLWAARAYAAYCNDGALTEGHVDAVAPLVLSHRMTQQEETEEEMEAPDRREESHDPKEPSQEEGTEKQNRGSETADQEETDKTGDESSDSGTAHADSRTKEEVFEIGKPFGVKRIFFEKDRLKRKLGGRRTKTASYGKSGRYVRSSFLDNGDIAVDAALRAAAPFQKARGRKDSLIIEPEDLRFKEREKKMGHLVVFVVDGSGSMGAQKRMVETKGAVQSLLLDCYERRDKVAFIVFRKDRAEVVLPPTSSFERAAKRLREIPVGGRTPLSAGLLEAYRLVKRTALQKPQTRCLMVLVTDGRANQGLTEEPVDREIGRIAGLLSTLKRTDHIVVDVEDKKSLTKMDLALPLAHRLGARYFRPADLKSDNLAGMVREAKTVQMSNE